MLWEILWRRKISLSLSFCITFSIVSILWQRNPFAQGVGWFGRMADQIGGIIDSGLSVPGNLWVRLDQYRDMQARYQQAQKLLEQYRLEKDKFDELKRENEELRKALEFPAPVEYASVKAEVLGIRLNSVSPRLLIRSGRDDGIEPFMPVIAATHDESQNLIRGVVGIIASVSDSTSIVQPLVHPDFRLGVRMPDTGQWAILSGNSGNATLAKLTYLSSDPRPGKTVFKDPAVDVVKTHIVTSGQGGVFPEGIPVGIIDRAGSQAGEFQTAMVRPYAMLDRLETVIVILKRPEPWAEQLNEQLPEDGLITEYGEAEFPELPEKKKKEEKKPVQNEQKDEGGEGEKPDPRENREPRRRIQNVDGATPGL